MARLQPEECLDRLGCRRQGLTSSEASIRRGLYGPNQVAPSGQRNHFAAFASNFVHLLALLLWISVAPPPWFQDTLENAVAIVEMTR